MGEGFGLAVRGGRWPSVARSHGPARLAVPSNPLSGKGPGFMILAPFHPIFDSSAWWKACPALGIQAGRKLRLNGDGRCHLADRDPPQGWRLARQTRAHTGVNDHWQIAIDERGTGCILRQEGSGVTAILAAIRRAGAC